MLSLIYRRVIALIIDMSVCIFIGCLLGIIISQVTSTHFLNQKISVYIAYVLTIFKDVLYVTGSIGKRYMDISISNQGFNDYFFIRKIVRNITLPIFPIELVIAFIFKGKRIGDYLAKTCVIISKFG